jgi:hypothetical protein
MRKGSNESILIGVCTLLAVLLFLVALTAVSGANSSAMTETETVTSTTTVTSSITGLYPLAFEQCYEGSCGELFTLPWSISLWNSVIGNVTLTDPPGATIPTNECLFQRGLNSTSITFFVPFGSYDYKVTTGAGVVEGHTSFSFPNAPVQVSVPDSCVGN